MAIAIAITASVGTTTAVTRLSGTSSPLPISADSSPPAVVIEPDRSLKGDPVRIRIGSIGVDAEMIALGLNADGTLEVPPYELAGWFQGGPKPGEIGPAVIAAHVDSLTGPAVFFRLKRLVVGNSVTVDYDDGSSVEFVVVGSNRYPKDEFPTQKVYGPTDNAVLRLITCDGFFDRATRSYDANLVVSAVAVSPIQVEP